MPNDFLSPADQAAAEQQQRLLAAQVVRHDQLPTTIRTVAGVDVAYAQHSDQLVAAAVLLDAATLEIRHTAVVRLGAAFPYIPGLFSFRELPPIQQALAQLPEAPDLVICDGQGLAHPRRFGLACHLGVATGLPTIGCAKTRLVGSYHALGHPRGSTAELVLDGEVVGQALRTQPGINPLFVSIGHRVSLATACHWVLRCAPTYRQPETTRAADHLVNQELHRLLAAALPPAPDGM
ncbi:deoxyribonuclease V [Hymenobacter lucidus]|uniref:Endonuclease V n=1 Tax=Hymenobacter lucidus TaxID=2880930 RepID=A0ABS8AMJ6_9BACT|nr:deoxyribonuclease V [Hymenobacter lucidus]MCB2406863.1 deoxyribonuclease V [Hymenobacter lucidus]